MSKMRSMMAVMAISLAGGLANANQAKATGFITDTNPNPPMVPVNPAPAGISIPDVVPNEPPVPLNSSGSSTVIDTANNLAEQIKQAYKECQCANNLAQSIPRRFARGSAPTEAPCNTPQCEKLDSLLQEAEQFLGQVNSIDVQTSTDSSLW